MFSVSDQQTYHTLFCETSAKDGSNILEAVLHLARWDSHTIVLISNTLRTTSLNVHQGIRHCMITINTAWSFVLQVKRFLAFKSKTFFFFFLPHSHLSPVYPSYLCFFSTPQTGNKVRQLWRKKQSSVAADFRRSQKSAKILLLHLIKLVHTGLNVDCAHAKRHEKQSRNKWSMWITAAGLRGWSKEVERRDITNIYLLNLLTAGSWLKPLAMSKFFFIML